VSYVGERNRRSDLPARRRDIVKELAIKEFKLPHQLDYDATDVPRLAAIRRLGDGQGI
jgi:hypothetical protein